MRAKLLFDREITHPDLKSLEHLKEMIELHRDGKLTSDEYRKRTRVLAKAGHEIEHPEAWRLVEMGIAEPSDQECNNRVDANKLAKLERLARKAEKLEFAQLSQTPIDATDQQVADFKKTRAKKREVLEVA